MCECKCTVRDICEKSEILCKIGPLETSKLKLNIITRNSFSDLVANIKLKDYPTKGFCEKYIFTQNKKNNDLH